MKDRTIPAEYVRLAADNLARGRSDPLLDELAAAGQIIGMPGNRIIYRGAKLSLPFGRNSAFKNKNVVRVAIPEPADAELLETLVAQVKRRNRDGRRDAQPRSITPGDGPERQLLDSGNPVSDADVAAGSSDGPACSRN